MSNSAYDLVTGTVLDGRYQIARELGRGGMSTVYLAEHALIGRMVAVKVMHAEVARSAESVARFMAEARAVGTLGHPNVVASTDMGYLPDGRPYLILEYLEGWTLAEELERVGTLPSQRAVHIAMQIASAVGAAHGRSIVHRDLKSDNVFLAQTEHAADHVKILDFGISKFLESPLETGQTQRGIILGTPEFMAPEQIHSPELVDHRADIYALGTILHHMLTGRTPFDNTPAPKLWNRILNESPWPITSPEVPGPLAEIIQGMLAKDPADRPQSMLQVFDLLLPFGYAAGADRSSTSLPRAPSFFPRNQPLPLEGGQPTPLPAPMTITQAEHVRERHLSESLSEERPRLASPRAGLPAPGVGRSTSPIPGVGRGTSPIGGMAPGSGPRPYTPLPPPDSRPQPRAQGTWGRSALIRQRRLRILIVALTLLALGAAAAVFLVPRLTGPGAGAQVATGEPTTPVTGITTAPVTVNVGSPETMEAEAKAKAEPGETATEAEPADAPEVAPDEDGQGDTAVAAGGEQEPEVAEGEDDEPRDRRRRRRDRQRDSSSSSSGRRDVAGDKDSSTRPGEPSQGSVTPGTGDASGPAEDDEPRPRPTPTPAPEVGRVDPEATRRVVRAHLGEIRTCHERGRMDDPDLAGRVVVRIGIGRGGKVTSAAIASSTLATPSVEKCITSAVQKWTFPAPSGASTAVIEYPFVLR